ncbi:MAG: hypothetical protein MN733_01810 [Nitrososphaera sp.]|nr:hypothetical protein [Nitrososphaera sp.]
MNKKTMLVSVIAVLTVVGVVAVWAVRKAEAPNPPQVRNGQDQNPTSSNNTTADAKPTTTQELITPDIDTSNWKTYRNDELGFEVPYPSSWSYVENLTYAKVGFIDTPVIPTEVYGVDVWIKERKLQLGEDLSKYEYGEDERLRGIKNGEQVITDQGVSGYYFHAIPGALPMDVVFLSQNNIVYQIHKINNQGADTEKVFEHMIHAIRFEEAGGLKGVTSKE